MMKQLTIPVLLIVLLVYGCKKTTASGPDPNRYFLSAVVDDTPWIVKGLAKVGFGTAYDYAAQKFSLSLSGTLNDIGDSALVHSRFPAAIYIDFTFVPKTGRYYFNNLGAVQAGGDTGVIATYTYYNVNTTLNKWSTGGYVDINSISKDELTGDFTFTCRGDIMDSSETRITAGKFDCINHGGPGMPWPGP